MVLYMGIVLYAPALAFESVIGIDKNVAIVIIGKGDFLFIEILLLSFKACTTMRLETSEKEILFKLNK
jgi:Na+/proline symporter